MQIKYLRLSVISGFFLLLVLLAANAVVTRRQLSVQVAYQAWMFYTQQVFEPFFTTQKYVGTGLGLGLSR